MEFAAGALTRRAIQIDDILRHRRFERRGDAAGGNGRLYRRFRPDDDRHDRLGGAPAAGTFKPTGCRRGGGGCLRAEDRATRLSQVEPGDFEPSATAPCGPGSPAHRQAIEFWSTSRDFEDGWSLW